MLRQSPIGIKGNCSGLTPVTAAPFRLAANQKTVGTMRPPNGVITDLMVMNQPFIG
jgi:hypothetical protein